MIMDVSAHRVFTFALRYTVSIPEVEKLNRLTWQFLAT